MDQFQDEFNKGTALGGEIQTLKRIVIENEKEFKEILDRRDKVVELVAKNNSLIRLDQKKAECQEKMASFFSFDPDQSVKTEFKKIESKMIHPVSDRTQKLCDQIEKAENDRQLVERNKKTYLEEIQREKEAIEKAELEILARKKALSEKENQKVIFSNKAQAIKSKKHEKTLKYIVFQ